MRFIAALIADFAQSPIGTKSRLSEPLGGIPVLRRTLERLTRCDGIAGIHLLVRPEDLDQASSLLKGLSVQIRPHAPARLPYTELVRAGRWWGLDSWRGGVGGLTVFDEDFDAQTLAELATSTEADALILVPASAALISCDLTTAMLQHFKSAGHEYHMTFTQAPPGLAPLIVSRRLLNDLAPAQEPPGLILAYNPDRAVADFTGKEPCYRAAAAIIEARGRLLCDTWRSVARCNDLLAAGGEDWDAVRVGTWLMHRAETHVEVVPEEIEIELTTLSDTGVRSIARPTSDIVPSRGLVDLDQVQRIADQIGSYDDVRVVLGGFGEPLRHPKFPEICRTIRAGAAALAVKTAARFNSPSAEDALFTTPIDVVEVTLDAATAEGYLRAHGVDEYANVMSRIETWLARRIKDSRARPLILPSFVKCNETLDEMESFYESWQRRLGMALVTGHSHHARQLPARAVTSMVPARRGVCCRTLSRMTVLADGRLTTCDQDFAAKQAFASLRDSSLIDAWQYQQLKQIRAGRIQSLPLCPSCDEWHRP